MSTENIIFKRTSAGNQASLNAELNGLRIRLNRYAISSRNLSLVDNDPIDELPDIVHGGGIAVAQQTSDLKSLRVSLTIDQISELDVKSIGIYTDEDVLFAVASTETGNLFKLYPGIKFFASFGINLTEIESDLIDVVTDGSALAAQQLITSHETALNPHPQYARYIDFQAFSDALNGVFRELLHVGRWIGTDNPDFNPGQTFRGIFGYVTKWELRRHIPYGVELLSDAVQVISNIGGSSASSKANTTYIWSRMPDDFEAPELYLSANVSSVNEGGTLIFSLSTVNIAQGTQFAWKITGVSSNDISPSSLTGRFTIGANGVGTYTLTVREDQLSEGAETLVLSLSDPEYDDISTSVVINDTSRLAGYTLVANRSSVNEGSSVTFTLQTTDVAQGTQVGWQITGVRESDISPSEMTGSFVVGSNGSATYTLNITNDNLTEGPETLVMILVGQSNVTASVVINDTSQDLVTSGFVRMLSEVSDNPHFEYLELVAGGSFFDFWSSRDDRIGYIIPADRVVSQLDPAEHNILLTAGVYQGNPGNVYAEYPNLDKTNTNHFIPLGDGRVLVNLSRILQDKGYNGGKMHFDSRAKFGILLSYIDPVTDSAPVVYIAMGWMNAVD